MYFIATRHLHNTAYLSPYFGVLNREETAFNNVQREGRIIIENVFGRVKGYWGIMNSPFPLARKHMGMFVRAVFIMTNMITKYISPMRERFELFVE